MSELMPGRLNLLEHVSALEVGGTAACGAAGTYLALLGARVSRLEPRPHAVLAHKPSLNGRSYVAAALDLGKEVTSEITSSVDVVICDLDGEVPPQLAGDRDGYPDRVKELNHGIWVSITPFGLSGPNSRLLGGEMVAMASGGFLGNLRSTGDGRPTKLAGLQGSTLAGEVAGLAALHGLELLRAGRAAAPLHLEVSAQEAILATGPFLSCTVALFNCPPQTGMGRYGTPSGLFPCRDGEMLLYVMEDRHWAGVVAAMGTPAWAEGLETIDARIARDAEIKAELSRWSAGLTREACVAVLQENGVPVSPVNGPADLLSSLQLAARGFFGAGGVPGAPFRAVQDTEVGEPGSRPLRVLDLTQVLGPPMAASLAGSIGADVIKVEDLSHLDVYRRMGPFADGVEGIERSAHFAATNFSKRSVALDLSTEAGQERLQALIETADVLIENANPGRLARFGITPEGFLAGREGRLYLSSSGFGRSGPYASYRAFGQNVSAFSGVTHLSRDAHGDPVAIFAPWADLATALFLAGLVTAFGLSRSRPGMYLDVSMAEVVIRHLAEHVLAEAGGFDPPRESANDIYPYAPNGAYPTLPEGTFIAISVDGDAEWLALKRVLGEPPELSAPGFGSASARYDSRRELDAALAALTAVHDREELFRRLQAGGVHACPLWDPLSLIADQHLAARGFFYPLQHPDWGERRLVGLPWRLAGQGPLPIGVTATLGQHNAEVFDLSKASGERGSRP
jgi:crotonobetainyl-CoA:carnitine CoA-transferase CaiB-like acyl-CoA transferase